MTKGPDQRLGMAKGPDGVWRPIVTPTDPPRPTKVQLREAQDRRLRQVIGDLMREAAFEYPVDGTEFARYQWAEMTTRLVIEVFKRRRVNPPSKIVDRARRAVKRQVEREVAAKLMAVEVPGTLTLAKGKGVPNAETTNDTQHPTVGVTTHQEPGAD